MSDIIISSNIQRTVRDCIVYADSLRLGLRANGEEKASVIDTFGNIFPAEIPTPTQAATTSMVAAGSLTANKYVGYRYVYVASTRYPYVDAGYAINGSVAPRGNPSASVVQYTGAGPNLTCRVQLTYSSRTDIDKIFLFRTNYYTTSADALLAATGGLLFFVASITNVPGFGTVNYDDGAAATGLDQIEVDNYPAPTTKLCWFEEPYFYGVGNDVLIANVTWDTKTITLTNTSQKWFTGRDGQIATISGVITGGFDGKGSFLFKAGDVGGANLNTTCILTNDGVTAQTLSPTTGTGKIVIKGASSTLYRSKGKNPFSWGYTKTFGTTRVSGLWAVRVGIGRATAIATLPNTELLKIDLKEPSKCYVYNLQSADNPDNFARTRRPISDFAVDAHHSQIVATIPNGQKVLQGIDHENFAILQCDGVRQNPIGMPLKEMMRQLRQDYKRDFAHSICDDKNEINSFFVTRGLQTYDKGDIELVQYYPDDKWSINVSHDLSSSLLTVDPNTNEKVILGGTITGFLGKIHNAEYNGRFVTTSAFRSTPSSVTITVDPNSFIVVDVALTFAGQNFNSIRDYLVDNWIPTRANSTTPITVYYRVTDVVGDTIHCDRSIIGLYTVLGEVQGFGLDISDYDFTGGIDSGHTVQWGYPTILWEKAINFNPWSQGKKIQEIYFHGINSTSNQYLYIKDESGNTTLKSSLLLHSSDSLHYIKEAISLDFSPRIFLAFVSSSTLVQEGMSMKFLTA